MPWFRCAIEGENFPGQIIGKKGLYGFCTTRWFEADDAEAAEIAALGFMRTEATFQIKSPELAKDAKVYFTEIVEVDGPGGPNSGATWFAQ